MESRTASESDSEMMSVMNTPEPKPLNVSDDEDTVWGRRACWLIGGLLLVRVIFAAIVPLDLCNDEAYYWDWSRQLDWGYFSKPPMVAWLIGLSTFLLGDHSFGVRLPAALLISFSMIPIYLLGKQMFGRRVGFWAVTAASLTPLSVAGGLLMTIDPPLMFCWACTLFFVWKMLEQDSHSWRWMAAATVTCGLGLLSKQTMIAAIPLTWLFVMLSPTDRRQLKRPMLWLWTMGSLLFLTPVIIWNSQHEWITFQHTSEHFETHSFNLSRQVLSFLEYCVCQFGVVTPLVFVVPWLAIFGVHQAIKTADRRVLFLGSLSLLPLMGVLALSMTRRVQPNWPAPFHIASSILITAWAFGHVPIAERIRWMRSWYKPGVVCGACGAILVFLMPFLSPVVGLQGSKVDVTVRLLGWQKLRDEMSQAIAELNLKTPPVLVTTCKWHPIGAMAFYTAGQPRIHRWSTSEVVSSQYDIWQKPDFQKVEELVLITPNRAKVPKGLTQDDQTVKLCKHITIELGNSRERQFSLWHVSRQSGNSSQSSPPREIATEESTSTVTR